MRQTLRMKLRNDFGWQKRNEKHASKLPWMLDLGTIFDHQSVVSWATLTQVCVGRARMWMRPIELKIYRSDKPLKTVCFYCASSFASVSVLYDRFKV